MCVRIERKYIPNGIFCNNYFTFPEIFSRPAPARWGRHAIPCIATGYKTWSGRGSSGPVRTGFSSLSLSPEPLPPYISRQESTMQGSALLRALVMASRLYRTAAFPALKFQSEVPRTTQLPRIHGVPV